MDPLWLDDFTVLAEQQNFSRAAELRHVTQPAFSRRIRAFEEWLGVELFERTSQGARLTDAGKELLPQAEELKRQHLRFWQNAQALAKQKKQSLAIAATYSLSFNFFPKWIHAIGNEAIFAAISLTTKSMSQCEDAMVKGDCHFLLCHASPDVPTRLSPQQFDYKVLAQDRLVPVATPEFLAHITQPLTQAVTFVGYKSNSSLGQILTQAMSSQTRTQHFHCSFESHLSPVLLSMVLEHQGVAWLPKSQIDNELTSGQLVLLSDTLFSVPLDIRLYRPKEDINELGEAFWKRLGSL